jgi:predicted GH43/DUF377 family glycosyl hydrolase
MKIARQALEIRPDPRRVLLRPFLPTLVVKPSSAAMANGRVLNVFLRVLLTDEASVEAKLQEVMAEFEGRHVDIRAIFLERFKAVEPLLPADRPLSEARQMLLGSCFINEYSLESSALFNPSIVPAPEQTGVSSGELRCVLSLRATGEGHISSITFRSGIVDAEGLVRIDNVSRYVHSPKPRPASTYDRTIFRRKLREMGLGEDEIQSATENLADYFRLEDLAKFSTQLRRESAPAVIQQAVDRAIMLAEANYAVRFPEGLTMCEKVLFPYSPAESNGIEDARFVRFMGEDGGVMYYATYTAYNGSVVFPQMVETQDFRDFNICTLNGPAIRNKGLALFPRKINGRYAMLGRQDGENIHLMFSDHPHFWHDSKVILRPAETWEFIQLGNCGSPIETDAGWLVITHGVGPMRKYCLGAALLDLNDPSRVIGRLRDPLLGPEEDEREGYVPNVVYSCGALIHSGRLVLPYAVSDTATRFATIEVAELLDALLRSPALNAG